MHRGPLHSTIEPKDSNVARTGHRSLRLTRLAPRPTMLPLPVQVQTPPLRPLLKRDPGQGRPVPDPGRAAEPVPGAVAPRRKPLPQVLDSRDRQSV